MSDLDRVLYWQGISDNYTNYRGEFVHVPVENRKHLLSVMGVDIETEKSISAAAYELDVKPWRQWFPSLITSKIIRSSIETKEASSSFVTIELNLSPSQVDLTFSWTLKSGLRDIAEGSFTPSTFPEVGNYSFDSTRYSRRSITIPAQPPGYYDLVLSSDGSVQNTLLAIVPDHAFKPGYMNDTSRKLWGVIIQLYTLVSENNWGMGDFGDLKELIQKAQKNGADFIGLNPLHALLPDVSHNRSPYSPSDRRFISPLYIAIDAVEDAKLLNLKDERNSAQQLRNEDSVNYREVKALKYSAFRKIYSAFNTQQILNRTKRAEEFHQFCRDSGESLDFFCFYEVVKNSHELAEQNLDIVKEYQSFIESDNPIIQKRYKEQMSFHAYLQWIAQEQLNQCQSFATGEGMRLGLIRDLAVGADGSGAEVQSHKDIFSLQASIGAPPDPLALQGQNWGLPPMIPSEMRETGFAHYIELLRKNMRDCGALRIDHVMAIMRLWWCPPGKSAEFGAYVHYPFETMLDLLVLESHINKCLVIGEDLGIVPEQIREFIFNAEILSNKVLYFEKYNDGVFKLPQDILNKAFTTINNHDVPTLVSWWNRTDLEMRQELDILEKGVAYSDICAQRNSEKKHLLQRLEEQSLLPENWTTSDDLSDEQLLSQQADEPLIFSVLQLGARSASQLFAIQLEDLMLMNDPVNVPGTFNEYPNWKRKLDQTVTSIFESERVKSLLIDMQNERKK